MSPLDRLLQEAIPVRPAPAQPWGHWTEEEQDTHWRALCEAVGTPDTQRPPTPCTTCHLPLDRTWAAQGHRRHATCT